MKFQALNDKVHLLTTEQDSRKALDVAIEVANEFIKILKPSATNLATGEDALDEAIPTNQFPNQKVESWFTQHPYFTGERVALNFYAEDLIETKFYWLSDNATKARVSAGVMLTPNWEDSDLTRNDSYKVGVDFFLAANTKSLLVAISNRGNLRILEFNDRLSHTQTEILDKLRNVLELDTKDQIHEILWSALALSEVNKKFYAGVAEQFNILLNHLINDGKGKEDSKLFASRLLGRLLFLWFLRKKDIIDEEYGYFSLENADSTTYYNQTLSKLFFQTLNTPVHERATKDLKSPYLNGGLFEAHDNDWAHTKVGFPTGFFNGLYEHLEKYNFTTDESSPEYEQVAIDPEMLGRVFESLLATQLTETGDQARKAKGAFYTPREIVAYMCKESLRQYLYSKFDSDDQKSGIDKLLDTSDADWEKAHTNAVSDLLSGDRGRAFARDILAALDDIKVLDPACGSGAFPMGMLQLILKTYERLETRFDPYKTKLQIIQNNIFGVDIEPMAVEISRLRAWLSLIVDEENTNNVEPLPNLDFKFVCANSLIPLAEAKQVDWLSPDIHDELADVRRQFFNARKPHTKDAAKKKYYALTKKPESLFDSKRTTQLKSFDPFKNRHFATFFDSDYMFGVPYFDVVVGNPPYVRADSPNFANQRREILSSGAYSTLYEKWDLFVPFIERGLQLLEVGGILSYITSNSLITSKFAYRILEYVQENYDTVFLDYFDDRTKVFDAGVVPVIFGISKQSSVVSVRKAAHINKFGNVAEVSNIPIKDFKDKGKDAFRPESTDISFNEDTLPLGDICYLSYGLRPNSDERFWKGEFKRKDLISPTQDDIHSVAYLEGKNLSKYSIKKTDFLEWNTERVPRKLVRPTFPELYDRPKLFVGTMTGGAYDDSGIVCNHSIVVMVRYIDLEGVENKSIQSSIKKNSTWQRSDLEEMSEKFDIKYLLAIINSKFAYYYLNQIRRHRLKNYFYPDDYRKLPIIRGSAERQSALAQLVTKVGSLPLYSAERDTLLSDIDAMVYDLYGISDIDREVVERDFTG